MFLADKVFQSIKKLCHFARLALYHVLMLLVAVAYLDIEQPFKGFRQIHQTSRFAILIDNILREEQTADKLHDVDKGCSISQVERGKGLFIGTLLKLFWVLDTPFYQAYFGIQKPYRFIN